MSFETILYDQQDHVATVTLNRPDRLNAVNGQLEQELHDALREADDSEHVRVIILTGAGRGFCAGADISGLSDATEVDFSSLSPEEHRVRVVPPRPHPSAPGDFQKTFSYFPAISKPIIAAINGASVGLGFVLPLYCDMRIASDTARFGTAFAQRGLIAEHGVSWLLPRLIGISNAFDLLYSARLIGAEEALGMGLVSRVVPADELMNHVCEYARNLADNVSPRSLKVIKRQVWAAQLQSLGDAIEDANDEMIKSFDCEDFKEGVAHFLEKRAPQFTGR